MSSEKYTGPKARVIVVADEAWSSRLIERFDSWSHYANVLEDGTILDARNDVITFKGKRYAPGVQLRPAHYLDNVPKGLMLELPTKGYAQYQAWEEAGRSQLHKPYDRLGILDFITGQSDERHWRDQSAWFCDELGLFMLERAGYVRTLPGQVYKATPGAALMLVYGLGASIVRSWG